MITNEVRIVSESGTFTVYKEKGEDFVETRVYDLSSEELVVITFNVAEFKKFLSTVMESL